MRARRPFSRVLAAMLCGVVTLACCACAGPPAQATAVDAPLSVASLLSNASALRGRSLLVTGSFAGWTGRCSGAPPRTRSDWMLADAQACIYVSGPVPAGITPPPETVSNGQAITVRAELEVTADGRPYLLVKPGAH